MDRKKEHERSVWDFSHSDKVSSGTWKPQTLDKSQRKTLIWTEWGPPGPRGAPALWGVGSAQAFTLSCPGYLASPSSVRCCPNGNRRDLFSKVGPHASENIYLSPMFKLEDTKGTFCPESKFGRISQLAVATAPKAVPAPYSSPALSMFSKSFRRRTQECPRVRHHQACEWSHVSVKTCLSKRRGTAFILCM